MESDALLASYEATPYDSRPFPHTRPDRIAATALLYGVSGAPATRCAVLELGCASGGNLIPMAVAFPSSTFVGVDFSASQIETGRATIRELGLTNVTLETMSISDIRDDFGMFNYILCHGVYSWVPPAVQTAILRVSSRNLAPRGIAQVSYNCYPGWGARMMVREMLRFHDDPAMSAADRGARGIAFVDFLAEAAPPGNDIYVNTLRQESLMLKAETRSHLVHEQLEEYNEPVLFFEFMRRAGEARLQFVAESEPSAFTSLLGPETVATLRTWARNAVEFEQYLDFLRDRTFRQTLLCHADIPVHHDPAADAVRHLCLVSQSVPVPPDASDAGDNVAAYRSLSGMTATTNNPIAIAGLQALFEVSPETVPFGALWERVSAVVPKTEANIEVLSAGPSALADAMLHCAQIRLVGLHAVPVPCVKEASAYPTASALARRQAAAMELVTNLAHAPVVLEAFDRWVLARADGTRDREALLREMAEATAAGVMPPDPAKSSDLNEGLELSLARLGRVSLFLS